MTGSNALPSLEAIKEQARRFRSQTEAKGASITHSQSLEHLAHQYGFKDWNTLHAAIGNSPRVPVTLGARVKGRYLDQAFEGEVIGVHTLSPGYFRVTFDFDEPVDVVTFDSFSSFRKRVSCTINPDGMTAERTSNGLPQLTLEL